MVTMLAQTEWKYKTQKAQLCANIQYVKKKKPKKKREKSKRVQNLLL